MSRFDCGDYDGEGPPPEFWWQTIRNALKGRRGQAVLRELKAALLALPEGRLIGSAVVREGEVCALGALARERLAAGSPLTCYGHRGTSLAELEEKLGEDLEDEVGSVELGEALGLARALAWVIADENDEGGSFNQTPEARYHRMLGWIESHLGKPS